MTLRHLWRLMRYHITRLHWWCCAKRDVRALRKLAAILQEERRR